MTVVCLACHRAGWCQSHGITNDVRFAEWSSNATLAELTLAMGSLGNLVDRQWRKVCASIEVAMRAHDAETAEEREERLCAEWDAIGIGGCP